MSPRAKKLAAAGAVIVSLGLGAVLLTGPQSLTAPYWYQNASVGIPCPSTPPGPIPYMDWANPVDSKPMYFRYDAAVRPLALAIVDGHSAGQGGADHTIQYYLDGREIPLASGAKGGDGWPTTIYPAPYRNAPLENNPSSSLCAMYAQFNGPKAKPCPSGVSMATYSGQIKAMPQWSAAFATLKPIMDAGCAIVLTPTPVATSLPLPTLTKVPTATNLPTAPPPPATATPAPAPSPYADWIEQLAAEGITSGCGPNLFCPTAVVTREQMAVFLLRIEHGASYVPPPCVGKFQDVPCAK